MSIGVIACQIAMVEPKHPLCVQDAEEAFLDVGLRKRLVAVRCQQALRGGEDSALSVALYASSFQHHVKVGLVVTVQDVLLVHVPADFVVERSFKLLSPSVETKVKERGTLVADEGDEPMVTSPGVVGGHLVQRDVLQGTLGQAFPEQCFYFLGMRRDDEEAFSQGYFQCHPYVALLAFP